MIHFMAGLQITDVTSYLIASGSLALAVLFIRKWINRIDKRVDTADAALKSAKVATDDLQSEVDGLKAEVATLRDEIVLKEATAKLEGKVDVITGLVSNATKVNHDLMREQIDSVRREFQRSLEEDKNAKS